MMDSRNSESNSRSAKQQRKRELLEPHCSVADSILHIGCIGGNPDEYALGDRDWLHDWIINQAPSVIGIDVKTDIIQELVSQGYDIRYKNAEEFNLSEEFDLVVAPNIIEHLANPGSMLSSVRDHLSEDGELVVTTPRPWSLFQFSMLIRGGEHAIADDWHTCWFDEPTLQRLAELSGFKLVSTKTYSWERTAKSKLDFAYLTAESVLRRIFPEYIFDYQFKAVLEPTDADAALSSD